MKFIPSMLRVLYMMHVASKHGLDKVLSDIPWFRAFSWVSYLNPWHWFRQETFVRGEAVRAFLVDLGPIFVKFGQALSTRPDVLPPDVAASLSQLQDNVPPFPSEQAVQIIESSLGKTIHELFTEFDLQPLASASIAQVHAAQLPQGRQVVVKVLRPAIREKIQADLSLMKLAAQILERYSKAARRFRMLSMVHEFEMHLLHELDLQGEGANAAQLRRNFLNSPLLYVPEIMWDYSQGDVLVMERIYGIPVADRAQLQAHGVNIPQLAKRGVELFFTQVFRDSYFHADMHPGNIFVAYEHPEQPSFIAVDFGLVGSLSEEDQRYIAYNLYAFFNRDYRRVAELHIESGWIAPTVRVDQFESEIRRVCEPIFERPLHEISFAKLLLELIMLAKRFEMNIQPQLMLLQKTMLAVEGLGRQLYPELDLWATAKPFLERWMKQKFGPKLFLKELKAQIPFFTEQLPYLPKMIFEVLELQRKTLKTQNSPLPASIKHSSPVKHRIFMILSYLCLGGVIGGGAVFYCLH